MKINIEWDSEDKRFFFVNKDNKQFFYAEKFEEVLSVFLSELNELVEEKK